MRDKPNLFQNLDNDLFQDLDNALKKFKSYDDDLLNGSFVIKENQEPEEIIKQFIEQFLKRYSLPQDKSLARVINALRELKRWRNAENVFITILKVSERLSSDDVKIIGSWTYAAILDVLAYDEKTPDEKKFTAAEIIFEQAEQKNALDGLVIGNFLKVYEFGKNPKRIVEVFESTIQNKHEVTDAYVCRIYVVALIRLGDLEKAERFIENKILPISNKAKPKSWKKRDKQEDQLRLACNALITAYEEKGDIENAKRIFLAHKEGVYINNQLQYEDNYKGKKRPALKLDFHLSKNNRKKEGGITAPVAKIALLVFLEKVLDSSCHHHSVSIITGGKKRKETTSKDPLKTAIPAYIKDEFGVEACHNPNERMHEFEIPYSDLRKILLELQKNKNEKDNIFVDLLSKYNADLRRENESSVTKVFSEKPTIPYDFTADQVELAKNAILKFELGDYGKSCDVYQKLEKIKKCAWIYNQLGWVLYRCDKYQDAVNNFNKAIAFSKIEKNIDMESDAYRKKGWVFYKWALFTKSAMDHEKIFECYNSAIKINAKNFEAYHNKGMLLQELGQYEKAIEVYEVVYKNVPKHDEVAKHMGDCYKALGNFSQAKRYYELSIERSEQYRPKSAAWTHRALGELYMDEFSKDTQYVNFYSPAKEHFEKSLSLHENCMQTPDSLKKLEEIYGASQSTRKFSM